MSRNVGCTLTVILAIGCLLCFGFLILQHWQIKQDITGWQVRAQVSSEPNDMLEYMQHVKKGMERWGMTRGYATIIPIAQHPENDMALILDTVENHIDQAEHLTRMDRSSPEYQTGLDNLRGSIRELNLHASEYWDWHTGFPFWVGGIFLALFACLGLLATLEY